MPGNNLYESQFANDEFDRYSKKLGRNVKMHFKPITEDDQEVGGYGACSVADNSYDPSTSEVISVKTAGNKSGTPKLRGRKIYTPTIIGNVSESDENFAKRVNECLHNYQLMGLAPQSQKEPIFYTDKNGNKKALIHTYYAEGLPLYKYLEENRSLTFIERLRLTTELIKVLKEQFHDRDIIHNDLKPENIIVNVTINNEGKKEFHIKIIDVDVIVDMNNVEQHVNYKQGFGTISYMTNDALAKKIPSFENDIFAIGMCAIEILAPNSCFSVRLQVDYGEIRESLKTAINKFLEENILDNKALRDSLFKKFKENYDNYHELISEIYFHSTQTVINANDAKKSRKMVDPKAGVKVIIDKFKEDFKAQGIDTTQLEVENFINFLSDELNKHYQLKDLKVPLEDKKCSKHKITAYTNFALQSLRHVCTDNQQCSNVTGESLYSLLLATLSGSPRRMPKTQDLYDYMNQITQNEQAEIARVKKEIEELNHIVLPVASNIPEEKIKSEERKYTSEKPTEIDGSFNTEVSNKSDNDQDINQWANFSENFKNNSQNNNNANSERSSSDFDDIITNHDGDLTKEINNNNGVGIDLDDVPEKIDIDSVVNQAKKTQQEPTLPKTGYTNFTPNVSFNLSAKNSSSDEENNSTCFEAGPFFFGSKKRTLLTQGAILTAISAGVLVAMWQTAPYILATGATTGPIGLIVAGIALAAVSLAALIASQVGMMMADCAVPTKNNGPRL